MDRPIWRLDGKREEFFQTELYKHMEPVLAFFESDFCNDPAVDRIDQYIECMLAAGESLKVDLQALENVLRDNLIDYLTCVAACSQGELASLNLWNVSRTNGIEVSSKDQVRAFVDSRHLVESLQSTPPIVIALIGRYKDKLEELFSQYSRDDSMIRDYCHEVCAPLAQYAFDSYDLLGATFDFGVENNDFAQNYLAYLAVQLKMALQ